MTDYLKEFVKECASDAPETTDDKFIGWEGLLFTLVGFGLKALVPELKEWIKLGTSVIALKRLELKKHLIDYAEKKELDFPAAEKAAEVISNKINAENITNIIDALA